MSASQTAIIARDVTVKKGKSAILDNVSFDVRQGSIAGILGPSGAGKTTLMRAIIGVQKLSSGSLTLFDMPAGSKELRSRIGYVTQSPAVYNDLSVQQNLFYFAALVNASKLRVKQIIEQVRLTPQTSQLVESLSGGQKTRVSLAVALLGDPDILVLDEPTVGLDPVLRKELWQLFAGLAGEGKTLLISSHVMDEAEHCDSIVLLREGRILWNDAKDALLVKTNTDSVEAAFISMVEAKQ